MSSEKEGDAFLTGPKGIFLLGFLLGAMTVATFGFIIFLPGRTPAAPAAPAPVQPAVPAAGREPPPDALTKMRPVAKDDHIRGVGKVTIVEYADFECPYCKQFYPIMRSLMDKNKGKLRWVYRHLPVSNLHPEAQKLAEASECAAEQGKFWEIADVIFSVDAPKAAQAAAYAKKAGVKDLKAFQQCLDSGKENAKVQDDAKNAIDAGAEGTPFNVIMNEKGLQQVVSGAMPETAIQPLIDALLSQ